MSSKPLNGKHLAADINFISTPPAAKATLQTSHDVGVELTNVSLPMGRPPLPIDLG